MKPRILAVDDEQDILSLLRTALSDEGYDVSTTTSATRFAEIGQREEFDVYLIDITLRDGNGFELVRKLRQTTDNGIILMSGRTAETDHVLGLGIGADDYVTKPFRVRELAARVNAVFRRSQRGRDMKRTAGETAGGEFEFDGHRLSVASRRVWDRAGQEIPLTTAEFDLLAALLRRRGQVLDRDQLMNAIKGRDWESYDRAVDGLVSRLRRKLPPRDDGGTHIRTVHGVGYSFTA